MILSCHHAVSIAAADQWVGVAREEITPSYPIRLNGFGFRRAESEGVRQSIWAKAMAIGKDSDEGGPSVLIVADTLGMPDRLTQELAKRLEPLGVRPERLAIMTTHTHTAPMVNFVSPTLFGTEIPPEHQAHIDQYTREYQEALFRVAQKALQERRPATIKWARGRVGFAANRRTAGGPVDHDLPMLAVFEPNGGLRAIWTTYACHCVTLSENRISGDWAGYAQSTIEKLHPGCVALVSIGCGADANPSSGVTGDRAEVAEEQGVQIATEVDRLLQQPLLELTEPVHATLHRVTLPLATLPTRQEWEERAKLTDAIGHHARVQLAKLDRGESLLTAIDYPIQTWSFGKQLGIVFLPGEVVVDYAHRLKSELDANRLWVNAYANHCPGYVPSERILREGGYEGGGAMIYYDIPASYASGVEQSIVSEVVRQFGDSFKPEPPVDGTQGVRPKTPEESLSFLRTHEPYRVELVAAEPLVTSPVAIAFGTDGRLWVAEMYDYPSGLDGNFSMGGRVKFLRDTNADGRMDEATIFLDGIPFPTGITVWRDGVLVCAAPDILFARDTDGDGRADEVRKLFSGFGTDNYQARVNSLEYGLDGWVYGSCGLFGGEIRTERGETIALGDRDFRCKPDEAILEPATGRTQQGRVRNDEGDWFGCDNSNLVYHYPLDDHILRRNPHAINPFLLRNLAAGEDGATLFPISQQVLFKLSGPAGRVTAACGLGIYRDNYLSDELRGDAFTCEPVNNLVHRQVLRKQGLDWTGARASDETQNEFLASTDPWFRPVQARTGPDGALWIVDMYRYVIEHPRWIPPETLAALHVRAGADHGRIYRIVRRDQPPRPILNFSHATSAQLVAALESPNGTQRDLAMQQLIWHHSTQESDPQTVSQLQTLASDSPHPATRLQAFTTLAQLQALTSPTLLRALRDESASVRRWAVAMAATHSQLIPFAELYPLANDPAEEVQMQVGIKLANDPSVEGASLLARMILNATNDLIQPALISSLHERNLPLVFESALQIVDKEASFSQLKSLWKMVGAFDQASSTSNAATSLDDPHRFTPLQRLELWTALFNGRRQANRDDSKLPAEVQRRVEAMLQEAHGILREESMPVELKQAAIRWIGANQDSNANRQVLLEILQSQTQIDLVAAAIEALEQQASAETGDAFLASLEQASPQTAQRLLNAILSRPAWTIALLDRIHSQTLPTHLLAPSEVRFLMEHDDQAIRDRASKCFAPPADGQAEVDRYARDMPADGDARRGQEVFQKNCASCHSYRSQGQNVGPDISSYAQKPIEALLVAVLNPSQAIDPRYVNFTVTTVDGRVFTGIVQQESATAITLANGKQPAVTLARTQIESLHRTGQSLMPSGLSQEISPQAMADLAAFLYSRQ